MTEDNVPMKECEGCGKLVKAWDSNRWGDCCACRAKSRETDMGVGDTHTR